MKVFIQVHFLGVGKWKVSQLCLLTLDATKTFNPNKAWKEGQNVALNFLKQKKL